MEATPRPWEVDADFDYDLCFTEGGEPMSGWQIYGPKSWPVAAAWVEGIVDRPTGRANADLIVRAVNAHDRLVEALEWALNELGADEDPNEVPLHGCGYIQRPESGYCDFHEGWGNAAALLIELHHADAAALAAARGEGE